MSQRVSTPSEQDRAAVVASTRPPTQTRYTSPRRTRDPLVPCQEPDTVPRTEHSPRVAVLSFLLMMPLLFPATPPLPASTLALSSTLIPSETSALESRPLTISTGI